MVRNEETEEAVFGLNWPPSRVFWSTTVGVSS